MAEQRIVLKHRQKYDEKKILTLEEFKKEFRCELSTAINSYTHHEQQKDMIKPLCMTFNKNYKSEFYDNLRWNFNNNAPTQWYIDRIL